MFARFMAGAAMRVAATLAGCLITACEGGVTEPATEAVAHHAASDPAAVRAARAKELAAPTLSSAMIGGRCESQADCPAANVCVAVMPGIAECVPSRFAGAPPMEAAPNGRPAPPVGLLDGQVLRDQVMPVRR